MQLKLNIIKLGLNPSFIAPIFVKNMAFVEPPADENRPSERESASIPKIPKIIGFEALARCGDEVWIENNGQIYRLRRTRQGKLILTK